MHYFYFGKKSLICAILSLALSTVALYGFNMGLLEAVREGNLARVKELIDAGEDVNDLYGMAQRCLVDFAAEGGNTPIIQALIDAGADVNLNGFTHHTALHMAAAMGYQEIAEMLIRHNASLSIRDSDGCTPAMSALKYDHQDLAELLFDYEERINQAASLTRDATHMLLQACMPGHNTESPASSLCLHTLQMIRDFAREANTQEARQPRKER